MRFGIDTPVARRFAIIAAVALVAGLAIGVMIGRHHAHPAPRVGDSAHVYKGCHWVERRLPLVLEDMRYQLRFRMQRCNETFLKVRYSVRGNQLIETRVHNTTDGPKEFDAVAVTFWPYHKNSVIDDIAAANAPTIAAGEKDRCEVVIEKKNNRLHYMPNKEYLAEIDARNEVVTACGTYGFDNDRTAYWQIVSKRALAFVDVGQEEPLFDPKSLRLSRR